MDTRWIASFSASCFHAAAAVFDGRPLVDGAVATALSEPAGALRRDVDEWQLPATTLLAHLCALSAGVDSNRELAATALAKTVGRDHGGRWVDALARHVANIEAAVGAARPGMVEELTLRGGPLREQWEARGPGMLAAVGTMTEPELLVARADVVLVHPAAGGGGAAHLAYNSVRIEAVLANPHDALPEVVRLGWLLSMLNADLPMYSEHIDPARRTRVCGLSMLPAALAAAEVVELARFDRPTVELALGAWDSAFPACRPTTTSAPVPTPVPAPAVLADILLDWWQTYTAGRPRWAAALGALERMIA
jgi:hypothetical protein